MTKKFSTKRALVASILTLCMCFTMLIGTTFAWFTDSATSSGNVIKTGTLNVGMYWADGTKDVPAADSADWKDASAGAIFNNDKWEPGYAEVRHVRIANEGSLALKYVVKIIPNGEVSKLADVIDVYYADPAVKVASAAELTESNKLGTLTEVLANLETTGSGNLAAGKADTITLAFKMQDDAGNEYQNLSIGTDFSIQVLATQLTSESDSFGDQYDKDAEYPVSITVSKPVSTDTTNKTTSPVTLTYADATSEVSNVSVTVPAGVQLEAGTEKLVFTVEEADGVNDSVAAQITGNQTAKTYEISLDGVAESNTEDIEVTLFIEKGLIDVVLYHEDTLIDSEYDALTGELTFSTKGFSPFTVVSSTKVFENGDGTIENPYIINEPADLLNISKYYHEYKYYKVADGVETLDLTNIGNLKLNGSFDGNGVKIVNLTTALFQYVGVYNNAATIKISNMDVTINTTNGRALVRNVFNPGETIFENIAMHGYIEGQYNIGSFYNYGTANHGSSDGADYTVSFINATSDVTLVCTTGNVMGGMLGHGYEGADYKLTINMDENSAYTGKMYTVGGKTCYQVMAMCSHATYILNGTEVSRYDATYPSGNLTISAPVAGADGYTVAPVDGVDHYVVALNAQITAYDANGNQIANLSGMTLNLGSLTVKENLDGKLFDLVTSAKIVNGTDHDRGYEINDGELTVYSGQTPNYASGWITLQVNQYDAEGNLLATGILTVYTIEEPTLVSNSTKLAAALSNAKAGDNIVLTTDIDADFGIVVPEGVTVNGNGFSITYVGTEYDYQLVKLNNGSALKNVVCNNYRVRTEESVADGVVTLTNVTINMDNDLTGLDISRGSGTAVLKNVVCNGTKDAAHLDPNTQVQAGYTPYGDVLLGGAWALEATDCTFGSLHGWNTRNGSSVSLTNVTYSVFRMHYWNNRTLYINGVETAWKDSDAIPVAHDVGGCWSVQPAFK